MKKLFFAMAALAFMAWGCSSSDDDDGKTPLGFVQSPVFTQGDEPRPTWQAPNYDLFEQVMSVDIQLQDTLVPYASQADLLCATIAGEVRGVATPRLVDEQWIFPLMVAGNESGVDITLMYYSDKIKRTFTTVWTTFNAAVQPTGDDSIYHPVFVK